MSALSRPGRLARLGRLAAWAGLLGTQPVLAQTALTVQVSGAGSPLAEARVVAGAVRGVTGSDGVVLLSIPAGAVVIRVSAIGWLPDSARVVIRADTTVTIRLERAAHELEDLVASLTRTSRRVEDEAVRVEVLDTEEIEEKQLMSPGDVVMMLNETGGVRVQTTNPALGGAGIRIRGLGGKYTLVLADGLPLFGERLGAFGPLQIPPLDLGRVELVKGVASALAGGSALGGVVNLVSRPAEFGNAALLNLTSLGGTDAATYLGGRVGGGWSATILAGLHTQPRSDRDADGWADVPGYERVVARPRLFWRDGAGQSFLATAGGTVETRTGGTLDGRVAPDGLPFRERLATSRFDAGLIGRFRAGTGTWLSVRGSAATQRHRHRFGDLSEPDRHTTGFGEAVVSVRQGAFDLVGGAALSLDQYRAERYPEFDFRVVTPAVFGQIERGSDRSSVALSVRLDAPEGYGAVISPRVSGLVKPADGWSLRASIGSGFAVPTPLVDEAERNGLSRFEPLRDVRTERATSAALDLHGEFGRLEFNASVFASRIARPLQVVEPAPGTFRIVNAALPTRSAGTDMSLAWRAGSLAVTGSYAFVSASEDDPEGSDRRTMPLTPRHTAGVVAVHETSSGRVGLELYFTGSQTLEPEGGPLRSDPFLVIGLLVERRLAGVRVFLNSENLANVRQTTTTPLLRSARGRDGSWTFDAWGPLDGRTVNGGIRLIW